MEKIGVEQGFDFTESEENEWDAELANAWSTGYEAGLRVKKIVDAEINEPTPLVLDPDTLSLDEQAIYNQGYDQGYDDANDASLDDQNDEDEAVTVNERDNMSYDDGRSDGYIEGWKAALLEHGIAANL